jgi:hypothetical protein
MLIYKFQLIKGKVKFSNGIWVKCRMKTALMTLGVLLLLTLGSAASIRGIVHPSKATQHFIADEKKNDEKFISNEKRSLSFLILFIIIPAIKQFFSERFTGYS